MIRKERQRSSSPQLAQFSYDSPQLKQASTLLYRTRQPRYTSQHTSGHRQVVRHQLPKLTSAGSSPVARSMQFKRAAKAALFRRLLGGNGARTRQGASVRGAVRLVVTQRACERAARAKLRIRAANTRVPLPLQIFVAVLFSVKRMELER